METKIQVTNIKLFVKNELIVELPKGELNINIVNDPILNFNLNSYTLVSENPPNQEWYFILLELLKFDFECVDINNNQFKGHLLFDTPSFYADEENRTLNFVGTYELIGFRAHNVT